MKVLCMYDALYKNYKEQITYSKEYAEKFTEEPVVIGKYTDPDPSVDFIKIFTGWKNLVRILSLWCRHMKKTWIQRCWLYHFLLCQEP